MLLLPAAHGTTAVAGVHAQVGCVYTWSQQRGPKPHHPAVGVCMLGPPFQSRALRVWVPRPHMRMRQHMAVMPASDCPGPVTCAPRVTFELHEDFVPQVRSVEQQPFEVNETGWGEFEIGITVRVIGGHSDSHRVQRGCTRPTDPTQTLEISYSARLSPHPPIHSGRELAHSRFISCPRCKSLSACHAVVVT